MKKEINNEEKDINELSNENNEETIKEEKSGDLGKDNNLDENEAEKLIEDIILSNKNLSEENEKLKDKYTRLFAEFDNYRKRSDKEKREMFDMGSSNVIMKMLDVVDSFERGIDSIDESKKEDPVYLGFIKVYEQLISVLEALNVKAIEALNTTFDPELHNAIMHEEDENKENNLVVEELQKGYKYKDKVIRHSMVKVVN